MNNLAAYGHKFFLIGGAILIATAVLQWLIRPRTKEGNRALRLLDATTIKVFMFVLVGILAILVGTGTIPMGGAR
jgi:hypothetical protein